MSSSAIWLGCLVIAFGCFFAWLTGLLLKALGEITDSVAEIQKLLRYSTILDQEALARHADACEADTWVCHSCKTTNEKNDPYCKNCYVSRAWSDQKYRDEKK